MLWEMTLLTFDYDTRHFYKPLLHHENSKCQRKYLYIKPQNYDTHYNKI